MKARDFIKPGENILVIFTHGVDFELYNDGTGSTGEWEIAPNRSVDRVLIYHRNDQIKTNSLHIANYVGVEPANRQGRYNVRGCLKSFLGSKFMPTA